MELFRSIAYLAICLVLASPPVFYAIAAINFVYAATVKQDMDRRRNDRKWLGNLGIR